MADADDIHKDERRQLKVLQQQNKRLRQEVEDLRRKLEMANNRIDELVIELEIEKEVSLSSGASSDGSGTRPPASTQFSFGAIKKGPATEAITAR